jgi:serine/threonine-protein kinase
MDGGPPATEAHSHATMILADQSGASRRSSWWTLPADMLGESVRRIRVLAWLYALAFFLAGLLPALLIPESRAVMFSVPSRWLPAVVSIAGGLAVALLVSHPGLSARHKLYLGLAFEVLASAGIAVAEYSEVASPILFTKDRLPGGFGLSWVAPWVLLFTVVVPTRPVTATLAAGLSITTVPIMYALGVAGGSNLPLAPDFFFFSLIFPYLVVLLMAYVGSRAVYKLGTAVREARELGSYRLRERLGAGGMGEVWRAEHRLLARPAAIKLIRPEILGPKEADSHHLLVQRFEREAQATALMHSAHTVEIYDFGVTEEGTFYYVMELLDGLDLAQLVKLGGPVPPERAVHFLRQMCDSLGEAHATGLIHRDIKPANVYVCRHGRKLDFIKVLDFGLVKHGAEATPASDHLTADQLAGGTPAFMSPEQALGDKGLDGRSDLYAVGCVAYWLLTGSMVFQGQTAMETIVMHVNQEPEPPSRRTTQPIPPELEALILDCLAKRPELRPQTADELLARLDSVRLDREWTLARSRQWWDEHRPRVDAKRPAEAGRPLPV